MNPALQSVLLRLYRAVAATGLLSGGVGGKLFDAAYEAYKARLEANTIESLRPFVRPSGWVVDVGANVGFFTERFAAWAEGGRVVALEPERVNFEKLTARMARAGLAGRVICLHAAAAESDGELRLAINPDHPGDHRLAAEGVAVKALAIDGLMAAQGWPAVSLIKIDVQGAESRVLAGARETIARARPVLFIEIDDAALRSQGSGAAALVQALEGMGYAPHRLVRGAAPQPLSQSDLLAAIGEPPYYADFLFLPRGGAA